MKLARIWHPYTVWEEYHAGMWRRIYGTEREVFLEKAVVFTGDIELYGAWMLKVIEAWPISCEHNLTDYGMNRRAWIGHAACCLAIQCPEDITRQAWGRLSDDTQNMANARADEAIYAWEQRFKAKNSRIYRDMDATRLFGRDTGRSRPNIGELKQGALL